MDSALPTIQWTIDDYCDIIKTTSKFVIYIFFGNLWNQKRIQQKFDNNLSNVLLQESSLE